MSFSTDTDAVLDLVTGSPSGVLGFTAGQNKDFCVALSSDHLLLALLFEFSVLDDLHFADGVSEHIIATIDAAETTARRILESVQIFEVTKSVLLRASHERIECLMGEV